LHHRHRTADIGASSRDNKELFYLALDGRMMAIPMRFAPNGQTPEAGSAVSLFLTHTPIAIEHIDGQQYVVSRDGQRFLVNTVAQEPRPSPINIILNWKLPDGIERNQPH
jgi:hypothetical protein